MKWTVKMARLGAGVTGALAMSAMVAQAQALRDPTLIPPAPASSTAAGAMGAIGGREPSLAVLVAHGKPYVMFDARLYAVGDKLGSARIERITESEIWLRDGKDIRKISLYPGVQRSPHVPVKE